MQHLRRPRAHPNRILLLLLLAAAAIFLAACGGGGGSSPSPVPVNLVGSTWRAILIRDVAPVVGAEPTIRFDANQAGGTTGCNSYGGSYKVADGGAFKIDSMIMTEMACDQPRGAQEGAVIEILTKANRLEIVDGLLRISGPSGSITFAEDPR